jgi:hypothetical protein
VVTLCEASVVQVWPLRRCNETADLVNGAPFDVSWPLIEKDRLTWAEEGAAMVRVVEILAGVRVAVALKVFASITDVALQNNNAQTTSTAVPTTTRLFSANIPPHLEC